VRRIATTFNEFFENIMATQSYKLPLILRNSLYTSWYWKRNIYLREINLLSKKSFNVAQGKYHNLSMCKYHSKKMWILQGIIFKEVDEINNM
jgi:hypothetical protein